ncbi:hypothetical protein [Dysgonomonas termitidis]|uniref:Uncharacterized protein n=1 Tax=Dysgonomonas termitidis TaxID=1516126 RepID=A0ABV9KS19_9BACT
MKKNLSASDIQVLEGLVNIPEDILLTLNNLGLIDTSSVLNIIIRNEYQTLIKDGSCLKKDAVILLGKKYGISKSSIEIIVYKKEMNKKKQCPSCNKEVSKYKYLKNDGLCDSCNLKK